MADQAMRLKFRKVRQDGREAWTWTLLAGKAAQAHGEPVERLQRAAQQAGRALGCEVTVTGYRSGWSAVVTGRMIAAEVES